jgi:hypothetical protein
MGTDSCEVTDNKIYDGTTGITVAFYNCNGNIIENNKFHRLASDLGDVGTGTMIGENYYGDDSRGFIRRAGLYFDNSTTGGFMGVKLPTDATGRWQDRYIVTTTSTAAGLNIEAASSGQNVKFYSGASGGRGNPTVTVGDSVFIINGSTADSTFKVNGSARITGNTRIDGNLSVGGSSPGGLSIIVDTVVYTNSADTSGTYVSFVGTGANGMYVINYAWELTTSNPAGGTAAIDFKYNSRGAVDKTQTTTPLSLAGSVGNTVAGTIVLYHKTGTPGSVQFRTRKVTGIVGTARWSLDITVFKLY